MAPFWLLPLFGLILAVCAAALAIIRGLGRAGALAEAVDAATPTLACLVAGTTCYSAAVWFPGALLRNFGALCLLAIPAISVGALSRRAKKRGAGTGSATGAVLGGAAVFAVAAGWATLHLKGPRGGWTIPEIVFCLLSLQISFTAAVCFGWWCGRRIQRPIPPGGAASTLLLVAASLPLLILGCSDNAEGTLRLTIVDAAVNEVVPARVSLRHESGDFAVPDEALAVFGDCGQVPLHNWVPATAALNRLWGKHRGVRNPFRDTTDFYSPGTLTARLTPGLYRVLVSKGLEYREFEAEVLIRRGAQTELRAILDRWIDLPSQGWYGSDDHLHIPRPDSRFDPVIAAWMQAEDIHIANLLQMGLARDVHITPQRDFGPRSVYRDGRTLLVGGQENPRTHVLGHSIILGANSWIDFPQAYLLYDLFWQEAHRQGALAGYAHWAMAGAQDGLAVWSGHDLIDFVEVLNLGLPYYKTWYEALNLGIRLTPTAGTDYPCVPTLPGRERFYARLPGDLTLENWLQAVERGRVFVTNGPVVDFKVEETQMGDTLLLDIPRIVRLKARVRWDAARDHVRRLEILQAGEMIASREAANQDGEIVVVVDVSIAQTTWLAARSSGWKIGETPPPSIDPLIAYVAKLKRRADADLSNVLGNLTALGRARLSSAHSAPVYVEVRGTPALSEQPRARELARKWLEVLDDFAARLQEHRLADLAGFPGVGDGVTLTMLREVRGELLHSIEQARTRYSGLAISGSR